MATRDEMILRGLHNVENALAALAVGLACGADPDSMRETVRNFNAVEHRLEFCGAPGGVKFYNDSKATSVDATKKAIEALVRRTRRNRFDNGRSWKKRAVRTACRIWFKENVRSLVLIGDDAANIESQLGHLTSTVKRHDMDDAVRKAAEAAPEKDTVLLAPACASFDMFRSYEERGKCLRNRCADLKEREAELLRHKSFR